MSVNNAPRHLLSFTDQRLRLLIKQPQVVNMKARTWMICALRNKQGPGCEVLVAALAWVEGPVDYSEKFGKILQLV